MSMIKLFAQKKLYTLLIAALMLCAVPGFNASAAGLADPENPPSNQEQVSIERLENVWERLRNVYDRQGVLLEKAEAFTAKAQDALTVMQEKGQDTTALQAALDTFAESLKDAHPIYENAKGILNSHKGFDDLGKVSDKEQALETVKALGGKLKEIRELVGEPGKALREALHAFREARQAEGSLPMQS